MMIYLTACARDNAAASIAQAATAKANADLAPAAARQSAQIPDYPADCRRLEKSGARVGDRLDVAWSKAENAIDRGNARIDRCAQWYDDLDKARQ